MPIQNVDFTTAMQQHSLDSAEQDGVLDYAYYGLTTAVLSGTAGLVNTFIGMGDALGIADKDSYLDESTFVSNVMGNDAAGFYNRHKAGVDFLGMIASSIVPAGLAIKGLRAAQQAGKMYTPFAAALGTTNADIVLGSQAVKAAKDAAVLENSASLLAPLYRKAVARGFVQQVMENTAATAAMVLVNNQNATLNPDDMGYIDALGSQTMHALPWIGVGAVFGTGIDAIRIRGAIKGAAKEQLSKVVIPAQTLANGEVVAAKTVGDLQYLNTPALSNQNFGDHLAAVARETKAQAELAAKIPAFDDATTTALVAQQTTKATMQLESLKLNVIEELNDAGVHGALALDDAMKLSIDTDSTNVLAGMTKLGYVTEPGLASARLEAPKLMNLAKYDQAARELMNNPVNTMPHMEVLAKHGIVDTKDIVGAALRLGQVGDTSLDALLATKLKVNIKSDLINTFGLRMAPEDAKSISKVLHAAKDDLANMTKKQRAKLSPALRELDSVVPRSSVTAFYDTAARSVSIKGTPRIIDYGEARIGYKATGGTQVFSSAMGRSFDYNPKVLKDLHADMHELDAQWTHAAIEKVNIPKAAPYVIAEGDIPRLERVMRDSMVPDSDMAKALAEGRVQYGSASLTPETLTKTLYDGKTEILNLHKGRFNPKELAIATNMKEEVILGVKNPEAGNIIASDFSKPTLFQVQYQGRNIKDYESSVTGLAGVMQRQKLYQTQVDLTIPQILGTLDEVLPAKLAPFGQISNLDSRAGMVTRVDPDFGSTMEQATWIGKQFQRVMEDVVMQSKTKWNAARSMFAKPENIHLQRELATVTNYLAMGDSFMVELGVPANVSSRGNLLNSTGELTGPKALRHAAVNQSELERVLMQTSIPMSQQARQALAKGGLAEEQVAQLKFWARDPNIVAKDLVMQAKQTRSLAGLVGPEFSKPLDDFVASNQGVMRMSDEVARQLDSYTMGRNGIAAKREAIATATGTNFRNDPYLLKVPPMDLTKYRFINFVEPTGQMAAHNPTKYMLYAQTAEEMNQKIAMLKTNQAEAFKVPQGQSVPIGDAYRIVSKDMRAEYYKMIDEYDSGLAFTDLHVDSSKANLGRSGSVTTNLYDNVIDRMMMQEIKGEEAVLRAGIELKYADQLGNFKRAAEFLDSAEKQTLFKGFNRSAVSQQSVVMKTMLNLPSYGGSGKEVWDNLNTVTAIQGSKVVDFVSAGMKTITEAVGKLRGKEGALDPNSPAFAKQLEEFNAVMEQQGFKHPMTPLLEAVMQSSDPAVSASLPKLVKIMGNLTSAAMLRADPTHSLLSLTSAQILALPVIREALQALPNKLNHAFEVVHPTTGIKEPNTVKLYARGIMKGWNPKGEDAIFMQKLRDTGVITDYIKQQLDVFDMSMMTGNHTLEVINSKIDQVAQFVSKWGGHNKSEQMARFALADTLRFTLSNRGYSLDEMMPIISNAVDKVHGNYIGVQRPQLFNGVIGQNIGMFQTYFFNMMQHMTKHIQEGGSESKKRLAMMAGLQGSMFGAQSIPGFSLLNSMVASTSNGEVDLFNITDSNDPNSWNAYAMYGLASGVFGADLSGRGNLNPRYATIVPTDFKDIATVSVFTNAIGNVYNSVKMGMRDDVSGAEALIHGIAHNGMNRPLQGLGVLLEGAHTTSTGQVEFTNTGFTDFQTGQIAWGSMFTRLMGARPMDEAIIRGAYFRQAGYDAMHRDKMAQLGAVVQNGEIEDWGKFAQDYESAGGNAQMFNAFVSRNMQFKEQGKLDKFKQEMIKDGNLKRSVDRMKLDSTDKPYWMDKFQAPQQ